MWNADSGIVHAAASDGATATGAASADAGLHRQRCRPPRGHPSVPHPVAPPHFTSTSVLGARQLSPAAPPRWCPTLNSDLPCRCRVLRHRGTAMLLLEPRNCSEPRLSQHGHVTAGSVQVSPRGTHAFSLHVELLTGLTSSLHCWPRVGEYAGTNVSPLRHAAYACAAASPQWSAGSLGGGNCLRCYGAALAGSMATCQGHMGPCSVRQAGYETDTSVSITSCLPLHGRPSLPLQVCRCMADHQHKLHV